ncbi:hypothetical protein CerSpe_200400 [Prunus speciosa]
MKVKEFLVQNVDIMLGMLNLLEEYVNNSNVVINQWCERPDGFDHFEAENTLGYCDLEDVKQLISGGNNLNISVNGSKSNSLFSSVDENKTEEKVMNFY